MTHNSAVVSHQQSLIQHLLRNYPQLVVKPAAAYSCVKVCSGKQRKQFVIQTSILTFHHFITIQNSAIHLMGCTVMKVPFQLVVQHDK